MKARCVEGLARLWHLVRKWSEDADGPSAMSVQRLRPHTAGTCGRHKGQKRDILNVIVIL